MGAPSFSPAFGERMGVGNPQPEGRHNRSPASGETQCVPLWEIVVTFVLRNDGWPTQASFAWVGVFVVTTKIPALAERGLETGHAAPVVSPFGLFAAHEIH